MPGSVGEWADCLEVQEMLKGCGLSQRQQRFVCDYVRSLDARQAYQRAYHCRESTAKTQGPKLLRQEKIQAAVDKLRKFWVHGNFLTMDDVVRRYVEIAFADVTEFLTFGPEEVEDRSKGADPDHPVKRVDAVHLKPSSQVNGRLIGEVVQSNTGVRLKLLDSMKALQWLADYLREQQAQMPSELEDDPLTKSLKEAVERGLFSQAD